MRERLVAGGRAISPDMAFDLIYAETGDRRAAERAHNKIVAAQFEAKDRNGSTGG